MVVIACIYDRLWPKSLSNTRFFALVAVHQVFQVMYWRPSHVIAMSHPCPAAFYRYNINTFLSSKQRTACRHSVVATWSFLWTVTQANSRTIKPTCWWLTGHRRNPNCRRAGQYDMPLFSLCFALLRFRWMLYVFKLQYVNKCTDIILSRNLHECSLAEFRVAAVRVVLAAVTGLRESGSVYFNALLMCTECVWDASRRLGGTHHI